MDRLLRLNELTINNIHLPLLGDTALPTEKKITVFSLMSRRIFKKLEDLV